MTDSASPNKTRSAFAQGARENFRSILELHNKAANQGGGIVLSGVRGVGKGTLLTELRHHLSEEGRLVLFGRGEKSASRPYSAFEEPASQALDFLETRGLAEDFLDQHSGVLGILLPRLAQAGTSHLSRTKIGFFEALRVFLLDLGKHTPVSILLSDLHHADEDTLELMRYLAAHLVPQPTSLAENDPVVPPVFMVAVRTDDDKGRTLAQMLCGMRSFSQYEVSGLTADDLIGYLRHHPALERLLEASQGRPEDIDEMLDSIPTDPAQILQDRLGSFSQLGQRIIHSLAILGQPATIDLISEILGLPLRDIAASMTELTNQHFLSRRLKTGELVFSMVRPRYQEFIRQTLSEHEIKEFHHRIGEALEKRVHQSQDTHQLLAFHFLRGTDPERGAPYAVHACERLLMTFSYSTAIELANRALIHAPEEMKITLHQQLVEALTLKGDTSDALAAAKQLRDLAPDAIIPKVLLQIGELKTKLGDYTGALQDLEEALSTCSSTESDHQSEALPERTQILAAIADVAYAKGDHERTADYADQAQASAPQAPKDFQLRLLNLKGKVAYLQEDFQEAESLFSTILHDAESHSFLHEAMLAKINIGLARYRQNKFQDAKDILSSALGSARANGDLYNSAHAHLNLGVIAQRGSDYENSLKHFLAALSLFSRLGNRTEIRRSAWNLANIYSAIGNFPQARLYLEQSRRIAETEDSVRGQAFIHFTEGDLALEERQYSVALTRYDRARSLFQEIGEISRVHEMSMKACWAGIYLADFKTVQKRLDEIPNDLPEGTLASARRRALSGAILILESESNPEAGIDGAQGLVIMAQAIDEIERLQAVEDSFRLLSWLSRCYRAFGDEPSALATEEKIRKLTLLTADQLSEPIKKAFLNHPVRQEFVKFADAERSEGEHADVLPSTSNMTWETPPIEPKHPTLERSAEWDTRYSEIIGHSQPLLRMFERLDRISNASHPNVLIRGDSGTGKELIASAIHRLSSRASGPFIRVNCAALVETLLLSELFGHEKGSFTGALARKIGRFELARGGTLFLDEIGDISPNTQVSLLRVLQERNFERVGGTQTIQTDAVVICATHRDLETMVAEGSFRQDLYYRLRGVVVDVPPLRDRSDDIPWLFEHFLREAKEELGRGPTTLSARAKQALEHYSWPGNVREIQNMVRSVALFCEQDTVDLNHLSEFPEILKNRIGQRASALPRSLLPSTPNPESSGRSVESGSDSVFRRVEAKNHAEGGLALGDLKRKLEFEAIADAVRKTGGNITKAAKMLKMKRPRLSQIVNADPQLKAIKEKSRLSH